MLLKEIFEIIKSSKFVKKILSFFTNDNNVNNIIDTELNKDGVYQTTSSKISDKFEKFIGNFKGSKNNSMIFRIIKRTAAIIATIAFISLTIYITMKILPTVIVAAATILSITFIVKFIMNVIDTAFEQ